MAISMASGFPVGTSANASTLAITTANVGDLVAIMFIDTGSGIPITSVTDTNSRITWQGSAVVINTDSGFNADEIIWYGIVASTGSTTVTLNGVSGASFVEFAVFELHESTAGNTWSVVVSGTKSNGAGNIIYPTLVSGSATDQAYVGVAATGAAWGGGLTSGFTSFNITAGGDESIYNLSLSSNTSYSPSDTSTGSSSTAGAIFASAPSATPYYPFRPQSMVARNRAANW